MAGSHMDIQSCSGGLWPLPVGEVCLLPASSRQHKALLSITGTGPIWWVRHATSRRSGAIGRREGLLGGQGRCQATRQSCMLNLWPSSHRVVVVVGILGKKEDARARSDHRSS